MCYCGAMTPPSDVLRDADCPYYDAGAKGLSARLLHHRRGWPAQTGDRLRPSRVGPPRPDSRCAEYTIAQLVELGDSRPWNSLRLNRAKHAEIPIQGGLPDITQAR